MLFKTVAVDNFKNVAQSVFLQSCSVLNHTWHANNKVSYRKTFAGNIYPTLTSSMTLRFGPNRELTSTKHAEFCRQCSTSFMVEKLIQESVNTVQHTCWSWGTKMICCISRPWVVYKVIEDRLFNLQLDFKQCLWSTVKNCALKLFCERKATITIYQTYHMRAAMLYHLEIVALMPYIYCWTSSSPQIMTSSQISPSCQCCNMLNESSVECKQSFDPVRDRRSNWCNIMT